MKKFTLLLFPVFLFCVGVLSCSSDDDDLKLTKQNGKPSSITYADDSKTFFYYNGNRLETIKEIKGTISKFEYEDGKLVSVSYSPEDKTVADGHGGVEFEQVEGNKINISAWGEPSSNSYRWELELDDTGVPRKITETGVFSRDENGQLVKTIDGEYFAKFIYDSATKNLTKLEVYHKDTSKLYLIYDFKYDNNPGLMSKVDLPLWYYGYQVYRNRGYGRFSYCNANNILEESKMAYDLLSTDEALTDEEYYTITYSYTYNDEKYPVSQTISNSDQSPIKITY